MAHKNSCLLVRYRDHFQFWLSADIPNEVFETSNDLNPNLLTEIFHRFPNPTQRKGTLYIHFQNTIKFENICLRSLGVHIYNSLPGNVKQTLNS